jgi:hypothetical protein
VLHILVPENNREINIHLIDNSRTSENSALFKEKESICCCHQYNKFYRFKMTTDESREIIIKYFFLNIVKPNRSPNRKRTIKMSKIVLAIDAEAADIPVNPKIPAMIAMTRKITAQRNIDKVFGESAF